METLHLTCWSWYQRHSVPGAELTAKRYGTLIGKQADSEWLQVVPWGLGKLLLYIQDRYGDPTIYITESGVDVPHENQLSLDKALKDDFRIDYFKVGSTAVGEARWCSVHKPKNALRKYSNEICMPALVLQVCCWCSSSSCRRRQEIPLVLLCLRFLCNPIYLSDQKITPNAGWRSSKL